MASGASRVSGTMRCPVAPRRVWGHVQSEVGDDSMVGQAVPDDEEILTDICIVGAGPAGITIARELDSRGVRVLRRVEGILSDASSGRAVVRATVTRFTGCIDPGFGPSVAP
jgi:hypothetical protein